MGALLESLGLLSCCTNMFIVISTEGTNTARMLQITMLFITGMNKITTFCSRVTI